MTNALNTGHTEYWTDVKRRTKLRAAVAHASETIKTMHWSMIYEQFAGDILDAALSGARRAGIERHDTDLTQDVLRQIGDQHGLPELYLVKPHIIAANAERAVAEVLAELEA